MIFGHALAFTTPPHFFTSSQLLYSFLHASPQPLHLLLLTDSAHFLSSKTSKQSKQPSIALNPVSLSPHPKPKPKTKPKTQNQKSKAPHRTTLTKSPLHPLLAVPDAHPRQRDADLPEAAPGPVVRVAVARPRGADGHFALAVVCSGRPKKKEGGLEKGPVSKMRRIARLG